MCVRVWCVCVCVCVCACVYVYMCVLILCRSLQSGITRAYFFFHQIFPFLCLTLNFPVCIGACKVASLAPTAAASAQRQVLSHPFLYWYKSTNTDTEGSHASIARAANVLALLVQKYKY